MGEILSRPELRHWEIDDASPRLEFDLDVYDERPELRKQRSYKLKSKLIIYYYYLNRIG